MRRIAGCTQARVAFDVFYSWYSLHSQSISLMGSGYGEPLVSGVEPGHEGAAAVCAGMTVVEVVDSRTANQLYVPRNEAGDLLCPAFGAFAMVVAGSPSITIQLTTPRVVPELLPAIHP